LRLESPFPEPTTASVFLVGPARQVLVQAAHEPGNVRQAIAPLADDLIDQEDFRFRLSFAL